MLRLLEHYPSIQGEGPKTGVPTQFVRFAGCNLRCAKWPCDTPYAIFPKLYRKEQRLFSVEHLYTDVIAMAQSTGARDVCLTGGEPMMQKTEDVCQLAQALWLDLEINDVVMFSNGTIPYPDVVLADCRIVMDWKLPGSGEAPLDPIRIANYHAMKGIGSHTIKFTCADLADLQYAFEMHNTYSMKGFIGDIYVGPVWDSKLPPAEIVKFILNRGLPWKLNVQLHKYVWSPDARRT